MTEADDFQEPAIAIVGVAGRFPGADSVAELWSNLVGGIEAIRVFSAEELLALGVDPELSGTPGYVPAAGALANPKGFDAAFFGCSPREAELMDPQHRVFLECAWSALEDAAIVPERASGTVGVFAGCGPSSYLIFNLASHAELLSPAHLMALMTGNDKGSLSTRVAYKLNLRGPALTVQTACSTSLVAVHLACQALLGQQCDVALAGGATVLMPERTGYVYRKGEIMSSDGHCRAFDARAEGTVFGSGAGVVVLRRLEDAVADGDHIYAVIRGSAINNDGGHKIGYTAPSVEGQAEVIAMAQAMAGVEPRSISYVEAHGTGTAVGDPTEIQGLCRAFGGAAADRQFCAIGSLKTNLGHLDTAAGVAGLIKTAVALEQGMLPPSLHFERANPQIRFEDSPFFVNGALRAWPRTEAPRRAGVSSFGIGGTNAHVVLEEAPLRAGSAPRGLEVLPISARTPAALGEVARRLAAHLEAADVALADVAHTLQVGRRAFPCRAAVICEDLAGARAALRGLVPPARPARPAGAGDVVFLFPGQGSQYAGMARELYGSGELPVFRAALDECARLLEPHLGRDLRAVIFCDEADAALLNRTDLTQPALFAVEYALAQQWLAWGVRPAAMVGHSVGEYVAACLAGVFSLADGLRLIAARGRLMQATASGGMLVVGAPEVEVAKWLAGALDLAGVNGGSQCVVAGPREALDALRTELEEQAVPARLLPTERAFHSRLMDPILAAFEAEVARIELSAPQLRLISNLTGTWMTAEQATSPRYWAEHLRGTVRFADAVRCLAGAGGKLFIEVGPGRALSGLVRAGLPAPDAGVVVTSMALQAERSEHHELLAALGRVWAAGQAVDWAGVHPGSPARRVPLPAYPFERQEYWIAPAARAGAAVARTESDGTPRPLRDDEAAAGSGPIATGARHGRPALAVPYAPPRDDLERQLGAMWEELLGVAGIGIDDSFFELGGDSLVAVRLVGRIRERLDVEVDMRALFDDPTIARLAGFVRDRRAGAEPSNLMELIEQLSEEEAEALIARWGERASSAAEPGAEPV